MAQELVQMTLRGEKIRITKGYASRIKRANLNYSKKKSNYEEVFKDLMRYKVIKPDEIKSIEDFRKIKDHVRYDGVKVISNTLVYALEQTSEYQRVLIDRIRTSIVKLKSGVERKGLLLQSSDAWIYIDKKGRLRSRSLKTGRYTAIPDYYGTTPLSELKRSI